MRRAAFLLLLCMATVLGAVRTAPAQDATAATLRTDRLIVFKDGYCLVMKTLEGAPDADGCMVLDQVPDHAVLGSFWAVAREGRIAAMTASRADELVKTESDVNCLSYIDLIRANIGKAATIEAADNKIYTGTLLRVLENPLPLPKPEHVAATEEQPMREPREGSDLFVVRTNDGDLALSASQVKSLSIPDAVTTMRRAGYHNKTSKRILFKLDAAQRPARASIALFYFTPGVRWIPTYRDQLQENHAAELSLQGEVINELEDFTNTPIDLVVGVPNFRFKDMISPLSLESILQNVMVQTQGRRGQIDNGIMSQQFSNANFINDGGDYGSPVAAAGAPEFSPELMANASQDLFVYSIPSFTLKKGERATLPIFTANVTYEDVYTWNYQITQGQRQPRTGMDGASPLTLLGNDVWHQIRMTNTLTVPWTTGPAMVLDKGFPVSQDMLTYTPVGQRALLPLTIATDVQGKYSEEEVDRVENALRFQGYDYMKVIKKGSYCVVNNKAETVKVLITSQFGGACTAAAENGKIALSDFTPSDWGQDSYSYQINQHSRVTWELELKPGETRHIDVRYEYYIR